MTRQDGPSRMLGCLLVLVLAACLGIGAALAVKAARHHGPAVPVQRR